MILLHTSLTSKTTLFLTAAILSVSALAADFNQTQYLADQADADADAQYNLGVMYDTGKGVHQNYAKAAEWYRKAADQGYAKAQFNLGLAYYKGEGLRQDYAKAAEWFEKAADQGDAEAQYNLGLMYDQGEGVRQNNATAKEWFGKSCDNGNQDGCNEFQKLNSK
ncbi:tetratricopeptide repeat protein [Psychrobacter sp. AOP7-B1-24]|uniref:tetratricopeptide repeat protein n=1 Tax=Psychrobacter sp. AOP7-B1-24 TaxID=3457645 RepID=UPI00402BA843